jgi:hypothetical protein
MEGLQIPGFTPPSQAEVLANGMNNLGVGQRVTHQLLHAILLAILGEDKDAIEKQAGIRLTNEEVDIGVGGSTDGDFGPDSGARS